jgi:hypothetical protein
MNALFGRVSWQAWNIRWAYRKIVRDGRTRYVVEFATAKPSAGSPK